MTTENEETADVGNPVERLVMLPVTCRGFKDGENNMHNALQGQRVQSVAN